jgi:REP element-mobilizing transposase RayT
MARPIRLEFSGAIYHVTARGDRREAIYDDDEDRVLFLDWLGVVATEFNWVCHAYCLMSNHYHLVIETPDGNLSKGMRQLNGVFTQISNRRHRRSGHLFQGRYKAILIDADSYLMELTRYVVLNPVRAGMVTEAGDWPWSSYLATIGASAAPEWLATDGLLAQFGKRRATAVKRYMEFVAAGVGKEPIWRHLNRQVFLGSDTFIERAQKLGKSQAQSADVNIPRAQRRPPAKSLASFERAHAVRDDAIVAAYATGQYSYQQIADHFGLHFTTVGLIVRRKRRE